MSAQCTSLRSFRLHRDGVKSDGHAVLLQCERQHGHGGQHVHAFGKWRDDRAAGKLVEPHDCGHFERTSGCGGCDPGAIEYVRDDSGPWRKVTS